MSRPAVCVRKVIPLRDGGGAAEFALTWRFGWKKVKIFVVFEKKCYICVLNYAQKLNNQSNNTQSIIMKKSVLSKLFATMALGLASLTAYAVAPEAGKVYRIVNKGYDTLVMTAASPNGDVVCSERNNNKDSQLWLAEEGATSGTLTFRNLGVGTYMRSSNARSAKWGMTLTCENKNTQMKVTSNSGAYIIAAVNNTDTHGYAHCDAQRNVVGWSNDAAATRWDFTAVEVSDADIAAKLAAAEDLLGEQKNAGVYQELVKKIFTDLACTTLNSTFSAMTEAQVKENADFKALPATLQNTVLKVKSGNWAEENKENAELSWDSDHAKKYRVQMIEPYSPGAEAAELCGIQAYTNMNNPTGIVTDDGSMLYVMVEGLPEEGCTMYINGATGYGMWNDYNSGVELHNGLNVVPGSADLAHHFIYYTVNTVTGYQEDGRRHPSQYKVTEFPDVKVHIEGGKLNGFFNYLGDELYTPDTTEDFWYTANRASHNMYSFLGRYVILYFFLNDTPSDVGNAPSPGLKTILNEANRPAHESYAGRTYDIVEIMKTWDNMCWSERIMMGVNSADNVKEFNDYYTNNVANGNNCDFFSPIVGDEELTKGHKAAPQYSYHDYFNNRMMGITMQGGLFMNATSWRTAYNISTLEAIMPTIPFDSGSLWGPAHEYGHMNQGPVKVAGTTEISNNCFSNVAVYYHNQTTSRSNYPSDTANSFNNGDTYLDYGIWSTTRMYFQLFLYYHAAKHNTKFYPRLYELLRNHPLQKAYYLNPRYDALQFVRMCCLAAEEDLTNFFEAWGMFVPLKSYHIGDYANYMATLTEEDIKAVKDEIKSWGFPVNNQIILIDDRPGQTKLDGVTSRNQWADYMSIEGAGQYGGVIDFRNGKAPQGEISFALNGFNVEVTLGEGADPGVGFLVLDKDGNILGFGNNLSFPVNSECAKALIEGTAKVVAIGGNGDTVELENTFLTSDAATRLEELKKLVTVVTPELNFVDEDKARAGWYMPFYAQPVENAIAAANAMTADSDADAISQAYIALVTAYNELRGNSAARVQFMPGANYNVLHQNFNKRGLGVNSKGVVSNKTVNSTTQLNDELNIWTFETVSIADRTYRIKNVSAGKYLGAPDKKGEEAQLVSKSKAGVYTVQENGQGQYVLVCDNNWDLGLQIMNNSSTGKIGYWGAGDTNSQWVLRLHDATAKGASLVALQQLVADTKLSFPEAGEVTIEGDNIDLKAENMSSNAPYLGDNENDRFTSFDVLLDGDVNTYFHSNWANNGSSNDGKAHNITIDLGQGNETSSFQITWTTRYVHDNSPVNAPTTVRVEGSNDGSKFTLIKTLSDLPTGSEANYMSPVIESETAYRWIRLVVTATSGNTSYFVLSELTINNAQYKVFTNSIYPKMTEEIIMNVYNTLNDANSVLALDNPTQKKLDAAYAPLRAAYEAMMAAMEKEAAPELNYSPESSIGEITADGAKIEGIFDLQGRRLNKAGQGIFIINGEKVLVK